LRLLAPKSRKLARPNRSAIYGLNRMDIGKWK
jgi:hypothetical protein